MTSLAMLLLIAVLVLFWQSSLHSRDTAIRTAREICSNHGLQFLDGTASLQKIRPGYSRHGGAGIRRTYTFDYSENGIERKRGCIIMWNSHIRTVLLEERETGTAK
ncbi:MAG: DUF3301 domain-containing protein [Gammaproteobacteria bacterium]|jgi:hypothetical protein